MRLTPDKSLAGLLAPLFALRGSGDLGIGDVGALREFVDWAADAGFGMVQLLPINETGNDNSPYNAISSVALDPTTIEIAAVQDLSRSDFVELTCDADIESLRAGAVNYPAVKMLKRSLLRRAFENFTRVSWKKNDARSRRFRGFMEKQESWLEPYALFRILMDIHGGNERWDTWPNKQRTAARARAWMKALPAAKQRELTIEIRFVMFIQWIAWSQWEDAKKHAESRGVALMGDVPFGVSYYSADVFGAPDLFDHRWSGGAPPEPLFKDDAFTCKWGQNWGVPLYRWDRMRKNNFAWWRQRVRMVRDVFHLFRIDHVLGFFRIYAFPWRPERNLEFLPMTPEEAQAATGGELPRFHAHDDDTEQSRQLNQAEGEEFLRVLLEETGEYRLIGEDLGTVPKYVRPSLKKLQIPGFRIPFWERTPEMRLIPGNEYDRLSVATFATHDHEPLRATWERWMKVIEEALERPQEMAALRDFTWWEVREFAGWAGLDIPNVTSFERVHAQLLETLFKCNAWIVVCMVTDLLATTQRFNVPGAVAQSNWSQRLADPISQWNQHPALRKIIDRVRGVLIRTGRINESSGSGNPSL